MAYPPPKLLAILLLSFIASSFVASSRIPKRSTLSLLARLKLKGEGDGGPSSCWDALFELKSCSGELVLFFLNGETTLGQSCCNAIRIIEHKCWPSMMGSLGITAEEGDILRGYCDAKAGGGGDEDAAAAAPAPAHRCDNLPRLVH